MRHVWVRTIGIFFFNNAATTKIYPLSLHDALPIYKWFLDELNNVVFARPAVGLGRIFWKRGDEGAIARFGPDGAAAAVVAGTRLTARLQTGYLYTYALVMLLGVAAATTWAMAQ